MAQLYCYVPDPIALKVEQKAQTAGLSVSRYLAELIKRTVAPEWPEHYFEQIVGGWSGEILERPAQLSFDTRDELLEMNDSSYAAINTCQVYLYPTT